MIDTKSVLPGWLEPVFASPAIFANNLLPNTTIFERTPVPTSKQSKSSALPISAFFGVPHFASILQIKAFPVAQVFTLCVGWNTGNKTLPLLSVGSAVTFSALLKWITQPLLDELGQRLQFDDRLMNALRNILDDNAGVDY